MYEPKINLFAYYYSFDHTGDEAVDRILGSVAAAGKGYHHTESWCDEDGDGDSYVNLIQREAQATAMQLATLRAELERVRGERDELRAYSQATLRDWPESTPEEGDLQELAVEHGLLFEVEVHEPCGEACFCAENGDFDGGPMTCLRPTPLLTGEPPAEPGKEG